MKKRILTTLQNNVTPYQFAVIKKMYLSIRHGKMPRGFNFKNPVTFNEKINYLKLYRTQENGSILADKADVKEYVENRIGKKYLIPTISIYNSVDEIKWDELPKSFVIKATHSSGMNFICQDKSKVDKKSTLHEMQQWLETDYAAIGGEWQYNLTPRLICEEYLENTKENSLLDYKFFCFNGEPKFIQVDIDRNLKHTRNFYDLEWKLQPFTFLYENSNYEVNRPKKLDEMITIARKLSEDHDFLRIDLYEYKEKVYFGEITFHPGGGCEFVEPYEYDYTLGKMLKL